MLEKVLKSALGNAQDPDQNAGRTVKVEHLLVTEARVDNGPMFKRIRPRAGHGIHDPQAIFPYSRRPGRY